MVGALWTVDELSIQLMSWACIGSEAREEELDGRRGLSGGELAERQEGGRYQVPFLQRKEWRGKFQWMELVSEA
jgi:hypothetical protein